MLCFMHVFFSVVYIDVRNQDQTGVLSRVWIVGWHVFLPSQIAVSSLYTYFNEFRLVQKEVRANQYESSAYVLAQSILTLPWMLVLAAFCLFPSAFIVLYDFGTMFEFFFIYAINLLCWETLAQFTALSGSAVLVGMLNYLNLNFSAFLFSGVFLPLGDVPWPFRVSCYVLPLRWAYQTLFYWAFVKMRFKGAVPCSGLYCPGGFECPGSRRECYGFEGQQVLETLGPIFDVISPTNHTGRNVAIMLGFAATIRLFQGTLLKYRCGLGHLTKPESA